MASSVKPFDASNPAFGELDARSAAALLAVAGDIALVMDGAGVIRDVAVGPDGAVWAITDEDAGVLVRLSAR